MYEVFLYGLGMPYRNGEIRIMCKTIPPFEALTARSFQEMPIARLCAECEQERSLYASAQQDISPACVELIRRALAGDNEAWSVVQVLFMPLMRAWVGMSGGEETEDILQEALLAFARWAPAHPELTSGQQLGRALAFLRQCTKTALLGHVRRRKRGLVSLDHPANARAVGSSSRNATNTTMPSSSHNPIAHAERRLMIYERLAMQLSTEMEHVVCREILIQGHRPQQVFEQYHTLFGTMEVLRLTLQRILRRLRKDEELQQL